nr:MAG TPA: hypothetical protein [Caudoviricetes sp.]
MLHKMKHKYLYILPEGLPAGRFPYPLFKRLHVIDVTQNETQISVYTAVFRFWGKKLFVTVLTLDTNCIKN